MPPHCDTLDGPVVLAAKKALEEKNVNYILPWVYEGGEHKVREAFEKAIKVRNTGIKDAIELADLWFYETAVRIHREGEGAPYTGLKPAGTDFGPVLPIVDEAIEKDDPKELIHYLQHAVNESIEEKFEHIGHSKHYDINNVKDARRYVNSYLGLALYSHHLFETIKTDPHKAEVEEAAAIKNKAAAGHKHEH